jgi:hypothetical protein
MHFCGTVDNKRVSSNRTIPHIDWFCGDERGFFAATDAGSFGRGFLWTRVPSDAGPFGRAVIRGFLRTRVPSDAGSFGRAVIQPDSFTDTEQILDWRVIQEPEAVCFEDCRLYILGALFMCTV